MSFEAATGISWLCNGRKVLAASGKEFCFDSQVIICWLRFEESPLQKRRAVLEGLSNLVFLYGEGSIHRFYFSSLRRYTHFHKYFFPEYFKINVWLLYEIIN